MPPHVVIIGGGFGGLYAALALGGRPLRVTLVDRRNYHLFQPLLYQVATAALSPGQIASPIRSILRRQGNTEVVLGEVTAVDLAGHRLTLADGGTLAYDYLILAAGASHAYFGHDDWAPYAPGLKSLDDALEVRRRVLRAYEEAERVALAARAAGREPDAAELQALLTFVVVGGGPTGVELAGALAEIGRYTLARDFRAIHPTSARIVLVEGMPRLLSGLPADLAARAQVRLRQLGVEVRTGAMVTAVGPEGVRVEDEAIPARTVLWAAGVAASPLGRALGVPVDRAGRVVVAPDLTVPGHPEVYVIGDLASFTHGGRPLPGVAQVAIQQGRAAAENVWRSVQGLPRRPFSYRDLGMLAVIGRGAAIADLHWVRLSGLAAWLAWIFIHIYFLIGFENRLLVLLQWAWSYSTNQRGVRLITGGEAPPAAP